MIDALASAERATLALLHALGLAPNLHGQPAWPFAHRLALDTLALDGGLGRQLLIALACTATATALLGVGAGLRRLRAPAWLAAIACVVAAPWPDRDVLLTDATPTSFHRSPTGFAAASIDRGLALYARHCSACHGDDGRGESPRAARLPVWPPRLDGALLWRRADGETFWRTVHGLRTMPGTALDDAAVWALIDGMKALAAGRGARDDATWERPVAAPGALVRCADGTPPRALASYRGQRLRLVAEAPGTALPPEDPRVVTIALRPAGEPPRGCAIVDAAAWRAYARVAGQDADAFGGTQLIVDRDGWLRALGRPAQRDWSAADLLCRTTTDPTVAPRLDGLGALIAAMDADPVLAGGADAPHNVCANCSLARDVKLPTLPG